MQMNYHLHGAFTLTHCLPVLSRIRDKSGYTESQIIPNYMNYRNPSLVFPSNTTIFKETNGYG